jgi:CheY-like chemotaxis protein
VGTDADKVTILAVEDNTDTLTLLRYMLTKVYRPLLASDKDEALALAGEHTIDLFLLDINLGQEYTGIGLMQQLRDDPRHADAPMLALTAYAMPGDRERFMEMGFDGYVSKPFTKEALLETIRGVLQDRDVTP